MIKMLISVFREILEENPAFQSKVATSVKALDETLIQFVTDRLGHDRRYAIDSSKIQQQLGWQPEYRDFKRGVRHTILWYLQNEEWLRNVTSGAYLKYYEEMYGGR